MTEPLLPRVRSGDADAEREIVRRHRDELRRFVERQVGARLRRLTDVDDLCQEILARVFQSLSDLPPDADDAVFRGRMYQHARWVIADHGAIAQKFSGESVAGALDPASTPDPREDRSAGTVTRGDQIEWLNALIDRLDPKHGEVVRHRLTGKRYSEIARLLGESEATVRQRYSRILRELRRL